MTNEFGTAGAPMVNVVNVPTLGTMTKGAVTSLVSPRYGANGGAARRKPFRVAFIKENLIANGSVPEARVKVNTGLPGIAGSEKAAGIAGAVLGIHQCGHLLRQLGARVDAGGDGRGGVVRVPVRESHRPVAARPELRRASTGPPARS